MVTSARKLCPTMKVNPKDYDKEDTLQRNLGVTSFSLDPFEGPGSRLGTETGRYRMQSLREGSIFVGSHLLTCGTLSAYNGFRADGAPS